MSLPFDETLIEKATSRLSQFPGFGTDVSRRESLRTIISGMLAGALAPAAANESSEGGRVGPHEEVLVVYFEGEGTFGADLEHLRYITLNMIMYDLDGNEIGTQHGVHESFSDLNYMLTNPPDPAPPLDAPPVPVQAAQEWTKGIWTFADGSAVYAVGPARTHIVLLADGSLLFNVTTGQTITGGLGRYKDAYGVKQATGSGFVPSSIVQAGQFPAPGYKFIAHTIEVFRIFVPEKQHGHSQKWEER
jgi:hypothetical protein